MDSYNTGPRRIYILPTRFGLLFAGALVLMLLLSINYNNGLGHLFTFVLAAIGVVSMYHTQRNLLDVTLEAHPGRPVFAGELAHYHVSVRENRDRERTSVWMRGGDEEQLFNLASGGHSELGFSFEPPGRGQHRLPPLYLLSLYPLGLFCAWTQSFEAESSQLVYPQPINHLPLPEAEPGKTEKQLGIKRRGDDDFDNVRDHQAGDPISHIHWKHSARGTGLKTKQFQREAGNSIHLRWLDAPASDDEGRLSVLTRWVLDAEAAGLRYSLEIPGASLETDSGQTHMHACLKQLALWKST